MKKRATGPKFCELRTHRCIFFEENRDKLLVVAYKDIIRIFKL
jgi:hypothetical protein